MRAAAGYRSSDEPGVPNLPGYKNPQHLMAMTQPRRSSLKYVCGYPIVEDKDTLPTPPPTAQSAYARPQFEFSAQGGPAAPPLAHLPPSREQLEFQMIREQQQKQRQHQESSIPPSTAHATYGSHARLGTSKGTLQWTGVKTPGWLLYDRKVLRFHAYSCDRVLYSPTEEVRVRYFDLFYHMEDGSMEMTEPQAENSGLIQGKYLNRHRAKLGTGQPLTHNRLRVGHEIELYGRRFMITGCDAATRAFYEELGQPQPPNFSAPEDQHEAAKKAAKAADELRRSKKRDPEDDLFDGDTVGPGAVFRFEEDTKKQDQLDGKVLRFYACWDDTKSTFGQKLPFVIYYYLKNDTLEVAEHHRANTGRDPFPLLLRRCQLPKSPNIPPVGGRPMSPKSKRALQIQYYNWRDMGIGSVAYVYGRPLVIYDMDNYTRAWMHENAGLSPAELQPMHIDFDMGPKRPPIQIPPDMLRIGAEEDSRRNVLSLIPKPPPFDATHFMENWNKVLRFSARMVPVKGRPLWDPRDAQRRFIISFFLLDSKLSIFEPRQVNSGIPGGKFLERIKVKKEGEDGYLTDQDLQIGKVVPIFSRHWELLDADNNTCKYMEAHPEKYPHADFGRVLDKVCLGLSSRGERAEEDLRQALIEEDESGLGYVTKHQLQAALARAGVPLTLHEATTLVRRLGADLVGVVSEQLLRVIQARTRDLAGEPTEAASGGHDFPSQGGAIGVEQPMGDYGGHDFPIQGAQGYGAAPHGAGNGGVVGRAGRGLNGAGRAVGVGQPMGGYSGGYGGPNGLEQGGYMNGRIMQDHPNGKSQVPGEYGEGGYVRPVAQQQGGYTNGGVSQDYANRRDQVSGGHGGTVAQQQGGYMNGGGMHDYAHRGGGMCPSSSSNGVEADGRGPSHFSNNNNKHNNSSVATAPPAVPGTAPYLTRPGTAAYPVMPGYVPGSAGPLGPPPTHTAGPQLAHGYGNFVGGADDAWARAPAAGGAARVGGVPHDRPRAWVDPSEEQYQVLPQAYSIYPDMPQQQPLAQQQPQLQQQHSQSGWVGPSASSRAEEELSLRDLANGGRQSGASGYAGGGPETRSAALPPQPSSAQLSLDAHPLSSRSQRTDTPVAWGPAAGSQGDVDASQDQGEGAAASSRPSSSSIADPRFRPMPGGMGYSGVGKIGPPFNPNRSSLDVMSKMPQPKSLWQTSNQAIGGIFNPASSMRASSWNSRS